MTNEQPRNASQPNVPEPGEAPEPVEAPTKPRSRWATLRELVVIVAIALLVSFLVKTFIAQPFSIPSQSMENTLDVGDRIIVSKFTPQHSSLHRGDVIVFTKPQSWGPSEAQSTNPLKRYLKDGLTYVGIVPAGGNHVVKRIIGMPGDHVKCCTASGQLTVNGVAVNETYLKPGNVPSLSPFDITVPAGEYWVMGDNRSESGDSREHDDGSGKTGSIPGKDITGQVVAVAWPLNRLQSVNSHPEVFAKVPAK